MSRVKTQPEHLLRKLRMKVSSKGISPSKLILRGI